MPTKSGRDRRRTVRIPVDAVLHYCVEGMNDFELCHVLNVSTLSLEILLDQALPENTAITIAVRVGGSSQKHYRLAGQVKQVRQCSWMQTLFHQEKGGWVHVITAPIERPWSPMFIYDVVYSNFDPVTKNPVEERELSLYNSV
jgi:hypothetical protein